MKYEIVIHTPEKNIPVCAYENPENSIVSGFEIQAKRSRIGKYEWVEMTVSSKEEREVYLSLAGEGDAKFASFNGICRDERVFRQSPHDPGRYHFKMQKSAFFTQKIFFN